MKTKDNLQASDLGSNPRKHTSQGLRTHDANVQTRRPRGRPRKNPVDASRTPHTASPPALGAIAPASAQTQQASSNGANLTFDAKPLPQSWEVDDQTTALVEGLQNSQMKQPKLEISPNLRAAFRKYQLSNQASQAASIAVVLASFLQICAPYPRQVMAMSEIDQLRRIGVETKGRQQLAMSIFEPTACGKSTLAQHYAMMINDEAEPGTIPVIHAKLGSAGSARDMYASILSATSGSYVDGGNETSLRRRALSKIEERQTQLVILDEAQHSKNNTAFGSEIRSEIKLLLDSGHVPFVLLGTDEARPILGRDPELAGRMLSPCKLGRLQMFDEEDFELWRGFLKAVEDEMIAKSLVKQRMGLDDTIIATNLGEVCNGTIGHCMRLLMMALRNCCQRGGNQLDEVDLEVAADEWSLELGLADENPFSKL